MRAMAKSKKAQSKTGSRNRFRANGEGWINLRADGRYNVGLHIEHPDGTLERKETTIRGYEKADAWLTEQKSLRNRGVVLLDDNPTVAEYLRAWLTDSVKGTVQPVTFKHHKRIVENHIVPVLGAVKMKQLTPRHVERLGAVKREEGLALSTRRHVHTTLKKGLGLAHAYGVIPTNPAAYVKPPKGRGEGPVPERRTEEISPLSEAELRTLISAAGVASDRFEILYVFGAATGLREQELFALKWDDVDLPAEATGAGLVRIRNAVVEAEHGHEIGPVKTRQSRRNVEFSGPVAQAMRRHRKRQLEEKVAAKRWEDLGLVFPTTVGTLMTRHLIHKPFKRALRRGELPTHHGFGDLRHTFATLMFARGVHPKIVQEMMGHSSVKVTMDIYSQWIPGLHAGISDTLGDVFG